MDKKEENKNLSVCRVVLSILGQEIDFSNIENPKLKRILKERLGSKFMFTHDDKYKDHSQYNEGPPYGDYGDHQEKYKEHNQYSDYYDEKHDDYGAFS